MVEDSHVGNYGSDSRAAKRMRWILSIHIGVSELDFAKGQSGMLSACMIPRDVAETTRCPHIQQNDLVLLPMLIIAEVFFFHRDYHDPATRLIE